MAGNFKDLEKFQENIDHLQKTQRAELFERCIKELAAEFLRKVSKRTPLGHYEREIEVTAKRNSKHHKKGDVYTKRVNPSGKKGGTLRRGWTIGEIKKEGGTYKIEIINPVEYASYVEYGHRTVNHTGWVPGRFMMSVTESQIMQISPRILKKELDQFLEDAFQ